MENFDSQNDTGLLALVNICSRNHCNLEATRSQKTQI